MRRRRRSSQGNRQVLSLTEETILKRDEGDREKEKERGEEKKDSDITKVEHLWEAFTDAGPLVSQLAMLEELSSFDRDSGVHTPQTTKPALVMKRRSSCSSSSSLSSSSQTRLGKDSSLLTPFSSSSSFSFCKNRLSSGEEATLAKQKLRRQSEEHQLQPSQDRLFETTVISQFIKDLGVSSKHLSSSLLLSAV